MSKSKEFQQYLQAIYGDAKLSKQTMRQLRNTWKTNPDLIKNTAEQKLAKRPAAANNDEITKPVLAVAPSNYTPRPLQVQQIAEDDLRGISSYSKAFAEARRRGLSSFLWGNMRSGTQLAQQKKQDKQGGKQEEKQRSNNPLNYIEISRYSVAPSDDYPTPSINVTTPSYYDLVTSRALLEEPVAEQSRPVPFVLDANKTLFGDRRSAIAKYLDNALKGNSGSYPWEIPASTINFQQGGSINMNEQQLQQAFIQFLAQKTGAKTQQELEAAIQQLGEQGLKQAYQEFMQLIQQQQVQAAKFGAKLNYIKSLRGQCPEGYEMKYFKSGGTLCKKCMKKQQGGAAPVASNPIDEFKCGRKMKKNKK